MDEVRVTRAGGKNSARAPSREAWFVRAKPRAHGIDAAATGRQQGAPNAPARSRSSGQSLVELAFVVPILLILFVGIADLGRVFAVGVAVEAATRNAAELIAQEYVATPPGPLNAAAPNPADPAYYAALRARGAAVVCNELRDLPNTNYDAGTNTCPNAPVVLVCIHDSADDGCGSKASPGTAPVPSGCSDFSSPPSNTRPVNPDGSVSRSVEVWTCYHFTPLLAVSFFSFGDIWIQRQRVFTIACWFALGGAECG
jgi:hypothetical protein